jgi:hypothetical protein
MKKRCISIFAVIPFVRFGMLKKLNIKVENIWRENKQDNELFNFINYEVYD